MGKVRRSLLSGHSLADQVLEENLVKPSRRLKNRKKDDKEEEYVDDKLSGRILEQARKQQEELDEEHGTSSRGIKSKQKQVKLVGAESAGSGSDADSDLEDQAAGFSDYIEVNKDDERALEIFMSHNRPLRRTLADIIQEKLTEKQTEIRSQMSDNASVQVDEVDERLVRMYKSVGEILQKYRSGKLPKPFKVIPALRNWEQCLYHTEPENWSAAAVYQATRIFVSNLNARLAQRFFNYVLLPRVRDDISEYKRLNFHLYMALKKALFKPAAFFKGILLPLCEAGDCTLREALILSSILLKNSIPVLQSAAAIQNIADMDYNGANSIFLRSLLDKKYALPFRVIDAVVFHFIRFTTDTRELPVLWNQCLLTFVQRYKEDISSEQKEGLLELLRVHSHESITPEIRRELISSKTRDLEIGLQEP